MEQVVCRNCGIVFEAKTCQVLGTDREDFFHTPECYREWTSKNPYTPTQRKILMTCFLCKSTMTTRILRELLGHDKKTIIVAAKKLQDRGFLKIDNIDSGSTTRLSLTLAGIDWCEERSGLVRGAISKLLDASNFINSDFRLELDECLKEE